MAYKNADFFYAKALAFYGFRDWQDFDTKARKRNWRRNTYLRNRAQIERLQAILHGEYIAGATDAANEIKNTQNFG